MEEKTGIRTMAAEDPMKLLQWEVDNLQKLLG